MVAAKEFARAELYIDRGDKLENETIFERLQADRTAIEEQVGEPLVWERLDAKRACRIKLEGPGNVLDQDGWPKMIAFMVSAMTRLESAIKPRLPAAAKGLV